MPKLIVTRKTNGLDVNEVSYKLDGVEMSPIAIVGKLADCNAWIRSDVLHDDPDFYNFVFYRNDGGHVISPMKIIDELSMNEHEIAQIIAMNLKILKHNFDVKYRVREFTAEIEFD